MSRYQGGKSRNGKQIAYMMKSIVTKLQSKDHLSKDFHYIEPFIGMAGVLRHVIVLWPSGHFQVSDRNVAVVRMWQRLLKDNNTDFIPNKVTEVMFNKLKLMVKTMLTKSTA